MALTLVAGACSASSSVKQGERIVLADETPGDADPDLSDNDSTTPEPEVDEDADATVEPRADPTPEPADTQDDLPDSADDEQIDSLVVDCQADNDMACDILYQVTDRGTPEEAIALDCGGRGKPADAAFCTAGLTVASPNEPDFFALTSPALPEITDACQIGDMTACDFLFWMSPIGSEFEMIGTTCAGRVEVANPDCRTVFGN